MSFTCRWVCSVVTFTNSYNFFKVFLASLTRRRWGAVIEAFCWYFAFGIFNSAAINMFHGIPLICFASFVLTAYGACIRCARSQRWQLSVELKDAVACRSPEFLPETHHSGAMSVCGSSANIRWCCVIWQKIIGKAILRRGKTVVEACIFEFFKRELWGVV